MRRVALTAWHSILILLMIWGCFTALAVAVDRFLHGWNPPGLLSLVVIVACEAIVTQRLMARERRRIEEQVGARGLELVVIVVLVRLWSLRAETEPLLQTIEPWLRSPLAFFGGHFPEYLVWAVGAWGAGTLLAADILSWDDDIPTTAPSDSTIEREQMQQEWGQIIARYDRRYLILVLITFAAAAFASHPAAGDAAGPASGILPSIAAVVCLVAGLLLHSAGKLSQIRRNWSVDNVTVDAGIRRRWSRPTIVLVVVLVLVAPLLSLIVLVTPPPPLVPVANFILGALTIIVSVVFLLLLSPLILLLSLLRGTSPSVPSDLRFTPPKIPDSPSGERPLLPALIFWGCIALLLVIALTHYLRGRSDLRDALRHWRITRWLLLLLGFAGEWWSDARGWAAMAMTAAVRRLGRGRRRRIKMMPPGGPSAQLRALYKRMKQAGARRGVRASPSQTPYEFGLDLGQNLPVAQPDIQGLTETYVAAEYGPRPAGPGDLQRARRHWHRLQRWLLRSSDLKRRRNTRHPYHAPQDE